MADGGTIFPVWGRSRRLPLVMQIEASECALACLVMIARYHGHDIDLQSLRRRYSISLKGTDLNQVIEIAHRLGFEARPVRAELDYLSEAQTPCILHWDLNHFVVLNKVTRRGAEIYDPARGHSRMPMSDISKHFTGVVLELSASADFEPIKERHRVSLRNLTGSVIGLTPVLLQVVGLAFAIEVLALVMPFQMQWVLDQVLLSADESLLLILTFAFLVAMALTVTLSLARAWVISWLGATLSAQWITNLFSHLLKLPLEYFEKRHMGDILSRFSSVQSIQNTLTGSFVEALLDGVMGSLTLVILCLYSLPLTLVVAIGVLSYTLARWVMYRPLWLINEELLVYGARQQSELMESVRGVQTIKLANKESQRKARLANATLEAATRTMRSQRLTLAFGVFNHGLFGVQRIALIAMGAYLAIQGKFSTGMLVAYIAYADQFTTKIGSLIDKVVEFRMLKLHVERIADIALARPERHSHGVYSGPQPEPSLKIKNVSFRYAEGEPWILRNFSFGINAGESVAIIGPSGYGKTTLAKIMVGLIEPIEGVIEIGGIDIRKYGLDSYRDLTGAVMQDDTLFAGSIADNISLFDESVSIEEIIAAAKTAEIHEEIIAMPMAYESTVGDMGTALSGGQKQRIILARALFRKPKILVLDEATSHLDQVREDIINQRIKAMNITRVIIAHREATIASANRIIDLSEPSSMQLEVE